jgi:glucosamine-6-phosphate deaminase
MKVIVKKNYDEVSKVAAQEMINLVKTKENAVLGLPTGSTPVGMYKNIVRAYKNGEISFKNITTFNLDEYIGLNKSNDQSYYYFMNDNLFSHIDINKDNINIPDGMAKDLDNECKRYEEKLKSEGYMDIMYLGIGINGHIGFNEPDEFFEPLTHKVSLDESTIEANSRFFEKIEDVPTSALTMGIKTIFSAEKIILIAAGENKADAIAKTVNGKIDPQIPASILQLHRDVTIIVDEAAGSKLQY